MLKVPKIFHTIYHTSPVYFREWMAAGYSAWSARYKYRGIYPREFEFLDRSQWYGEEQLRKLQNQNIKRLIRFCKEQIPYYQTNLPEFSLTNDESDIRFWDQVPFLDKTIVKKEFTKLLWKNSGKTKSFFTSGTTGTALQVVSTIENIQREYAFRWNFQSYPGARPGDRFAQFTGHMIKRAGDRVPPFWLYNRYENVMFYSLYHLNDEFFDSYLRSLNDFQPEFIQGYPSALYSISRYIVETGKKLRFKVKAIFSASETLLDFQKEVIEKAFDSKIFQWYGNTEYTSNIVECPEHHFHIKEEYGLIEFKNQKGEPALPGEMAEMICTGFGNYAMPFIRYRIGDYAILSSKRCSCGRGGRIVEKIIGRNEDIILTPNRTQVGRLDFVFKQLEGIKEAQIYQDEIDHLQIRIVPEDHYDKKIEKKICSNLDSRLSGMKYDFQYLNKIPRENNGKYRYVISDVYRKKNW